MQDAQYSQSRRSLCRFTCNFSSLCLCWCYDKAIFHCLYSLAGSALTRLYVPGGAVRSSDDMYSPLMSRATCNLPMLSAACSLWQCLHDVVSHKVSAGLFLRVQANLEADSCLNMLWLLFLTPSPSRIMKLISLQHQHKHDQASLMTANVKTMVSVL